MTLRPIPIDEIRAARRGFPEEVLRTPLVPFHTGPDGSRIHLKLENLQPLGSFKLRGACNAMRRATDADLAAGVVTASAGNMAQGVAWNARRLGIPCHVVVPDRAPTTKLDAIERLGGRVVPVDFDRWWQVLGDRSFPGLEGFFVHPVSDPAVMAGNGTIGLEILEDLPEVDTILVPYGGGGLSCGIASAVRALGHAARVFACEVETAAPLAASLRAGEPREIEVRASFVDGIGAEGLLPEMWPLVSDLLAGSIVVDLDHVAAAVRDLATGNRVIAEGAGAVPVAAARLREPGETIVCVVSGGNIDARVLAAILTGATPEPGGAAPLASRGE